MAKKVWVARPIYDENKREKFIGCIYDTYVSETRSITGEGSVSSDVVTTRFDSTHTKK